MYVLEWNHLLLPISHTVLADSKRKRTVTIGLLMVKAKHTNLQDLLMCQEEGCVATF